MILSVFLRIPCCVMFPWGKTMIPPESVIQGDDSKNVLFGTAEDEILYGYGGNDWVEAGDGNDLIIGGEGNDALTGGEGDDTLQGGQGDDQLNGGRGHDLLEGGEGRDILIGGPGADIFVGGEGADVIRVGELRMNPDELIGSTAASEPSETAQLDGILGFDPVEGDTIDLSAVQNQATYDGLISGPEDLAQFVSIIEITDLSPDTFPRYAGVFDPSSALQGAGLVLDLSSRGSPAQLLAFIDHGDAVLLNQLKDDFLLYSISA